MERACKGNADDMGETCECCTRDGSSRLTEPWLILGAATLGVAGVPLDEDILPMYHDYNQNGKGYGGAQSYHQLVNMNITFLEYELTGTQPRSPLSFTT